MHKKASVIITSYNQKKYLIEAVESVINQTVKAHEIIIADDHSTDGSVEVINKYIARYPEWIKGIFQKENVGIPKNRNSALQKVTGDYVSILDGDDLLLPQWIERMMDVLGADPMTRCVYSNIRIINQEGEFIEIRDKMLQQSGDIFHEIALGNFGILRSMIIDYNLLKSIGFFDEKIPKYDGFDLTVRLAKICRYSYIDEPIAEYRVHPLSDSKTLKAKDHLHDLGIIYNKMLPLLKDLPKIQKKEIEKVWYQMLLRIYSNDTVEAGNKIKLYFLPLMALFHGYVNLNNFYDASKFYYKNIKQY